MTGDTDYRLQARAVFLAAIMVLSVVGGSMAFAGTAAAQADSLTVDEEFVQPDGEISITANVSSGANATAIINDSENLQSEEVFIEDDDTDIDETISLGDVFGDETPADGNATVYISEGNSVDATDADAEATFEIDGTAPVLSGAELDAFESGDIVAEGDDVEVSVEVDEENLDTVTADVSAFNADAGDDGILTLEEDTNNPGNFTGTVTVADEGNTTQGEQSIEVTATDLAGNSDTVETLNEVTVDTVDPESNIIQIGDEDELVLESAEDLQIIYENIDENTESATITLEGDSFDADGDTYTYEIDDSSNIDGSQQAIWLDLENQRTSGSGQLADGSYNISIEVEDRAGNTDSDSTDDAPLVIDDDNPRVTLEGLDPDTNVGPEDEVDLTYTYEDATNATEVTVNFYDASDTPSWSSLGNADPVDTTTIDVDHESGEFTETIDLGALAVEDNTVYDVEIEVEDSVSNTQDTFDSDALVINDFAPAIDSVEADAGLDTITVEFNEGVESTDGTSLDRTHFTYQNASDEGAGAIEAVDHEVGSNVATLYLDEEVSADDLETDAVSIRDGEVVDMAPSGFEKEVDSGVAVELEDTTSPTFTIDAESIYQGNEEDYEVNLELGQEFADVSVTIDDEEYTEDNVRHSVTADNFDVSELEDGSVEITVEVTDLAGNSASQTITVNKDTVSPEIESVETNAATDEIVVTFDKEIANPRGSDFDLEGVDADIENTLFDSDRTVTLVLDDFIQFDQINNSDVANISAPGIVDTAGNPAADDSVALDDTEKPTLEYISDAEVNSDEFIVIFSESVVNATGDALNESDFEYVDVSEDGPSEIVEVEHNPESNYATVTLDEELTADSIDTDEITLLADSAVDANDNVADEQSIVVSDNMPPQISLDAEVDESTVTYTIESNEELESISLDVDPVYELFENQIRPENEVASDSFGIEDFELEEGDAYNYTVEFDAPRDGEFNANVRVEDFGGNSEEEFSQDVIDTDDVSVSGAYLSQGPDNSVIITFDQPIFEFAVNPTDIEVDGVNVVDIAERVPGAILVEVDESLQTGDEPEVTIDGDSLIQRSNDEEGQTSSATIDTAWYTVDEGTNFVSVPALSGGQSLDDLNTENVDVIWTYVDGEWQSYDPDASSNDFDTLEGGQGYIVEMDAEDTLEVNVFNQEASSTGDVDGALLNQQQLDEGWNLVGHYQTYQQDRQTALSSVGDDVHLVYGQDEDLDYELIDSEDSLMPGDAYWVFVTDDTVYTFTP